MSFGVDVLGTLTEKLRNMFDETQGKYSNFMNTNKLYKDKGINEKEFFLRITEYIVNLSALNFLAIRVVLEIKSAIEKGTSIKDATGGLASSPNSGQFSFGVGSFISTGGSVGITDTSQQAQSDLIPTFKPVDIEIERHMPAVQQKNSKQNSDKRCGTCGATISQKAKFCSKCGNIQ
jgi:hypothetical protein